jgi:anti-sigma28 factor (negative regulator of flagellin synthesis)
LSANSGTNAENESARPERTDSIMIPDAARLVDRSCRPGKAEPAFDIQRIAEPRNTIHTGYYVINPELIVEKLHQFATRLQQEVPLCQKDQAIPGYR